MTPKQSIASGLRKFARFSGRSTPPEFWWLIAALVLVEAIIVGLFSISGAFQIATFQLGGVTVSALFAITCVALAIPFLSVSWRRLHDIGWPGWVVLIWAAFVYYFVGMLFIVAADIRDCLQTEVNKCVGEIAWGFGFAPTVALIFFFGAFMVIMSLASEVEANKYGPNPAEEE